MQYGNGYAAGAFGSGDGTVVQSHNRRLRLLFWSFLTIFIFVGLGLVRVHTSPDSRLSAEELTHIGQMELRVPRGEIRDREGNLLAKDRRVNSLWADPRKIDEPARAAEYLSTAFNIPEAELRDRLTALGANGEKKKFVWLKRWLTENEVETFENLDSSLSRGLALKSELVRYYPEGDLAAHVIGFVNKSGDGCDGVELSYDKYLKCVPGTRKSRVDAKRRVMESLTLEYVEQEGGENVSLTIDKAIQRSLELELDRGMLECKAPRAMGIVLEPHTGAVLAMAVRPAYDPNQFSEVPPELYKNRAVVDVFEPGSAFKIVTFAAALEHGLITPETSINCEGGAFNPYGHRITDVHKMGIVPVSHAFAESSNIATIKIAAMLAPERLETWVRRFGFGEKTSADFPTESRGIVHSRDKWSRLTMGAIPIGQEVAVTMPQLARAFCAIANGGYLIQPYLVERVVEADGTVIFQHTAPPPQRILSEQTAATMKELSHLVVRDGTGKYASIQEYRVGGKTGTAQIARPDGKGFYPDKYTTTFAGFAPVSDPKLCAVIVVQEPDIKLHYGGYVCGPLFKNVIRESLIRMNCPQDPMIDINNNSNARGKDLQLAASVDEDDPDTVAGRSDAEPIILEAGPADNLDGLALIALDEHADAEGPVLQDMSGLTKRQAKAQLDLLGLRWDSQGAGRVVSQDPPPGTPLSDVTMSRLVFANQPMVKEIDKVEKSRRPGRK